jgi:hypothetical protein
MAFMHSDKETKKGSYSYNDSELYLVSVMTRLMKILKRREILESQDMTAIMRPEYSLPLDPIMALSSSLSC